MTGRTSWRRRAIALLAVLVAAAALVSVVRALTTTDRHGARVERLGRSYVVVPQGGARGRPMLVFLHGRGGGPRSNLVEEMFAALAREGKRAPLVVLPDGGDHGYWHDRAGRAWGRYVVDTVVPRALRRWHADARRVAIGGISMGGFGALDIARLHPGRFCAAGAHSPALWRTGGETAPGAFDDADDFARHDVIGAMERTPRAFGGTRLWLDAGTSDPFDPGDRAFAAAARRSGVPLRVHRWPGGHEGAYWRAHWGAYVRFYAAALAAC